MSQKILQINLSYSISRSDLESAWLDAVQAVADVPGLLWKVWLIDENRKEAGGLYLFENEAAALSYMDSTIVASMKASPAVSNISAKLFDVIEPHSVVTRGPLTRMHDAATGK